MSLAYAILGLLEEGPMTGYDLKTIWFDRTIAHFWSSDQAQIYRTLDKLAEQGWVESRIERQEDRPNRKVYNITETGRTEFKRWLGVLQPQATVRDAFMIQLFFGTQLSNQALVALVGKEQQLHQEKLDYYTRTLEQAQALQPTSRARALRVMTIERGVRREQAYIE